MRGIAVGVVLLACSWKLFVSRTYWHFPAIEEDPEDVERFRRGLAEFMQDGPPILTEDQIMQFLDHGWPAALLKRAPLDSTCPEASAPLRFSVHSAQHVVSPMLGVLLLHRLVIDEFAPKELMALLDKANKQFKPYTWCATPPCTHEMVAHLACNGPPLLSTAAGTSTTSKTTRPSPTWGTSSQS